VELVRRPLPVLVRKSGIEGQIGAVADRFKPDGGYGGCAWNPETKTVFWQGADWSSTEDHDAARDAFLAIPGVENFDGEAEAALPTAGDWQIIRKDAPTATDVHVDVPLGEAKPKRKRKKGEPVETSTPELSVLKADDEARVVYGIVLEPDVEDSQGDVVSKEDVEIAAHRYLYQQGLAIGDQHRKMAPETVRPVESYIAPCDFQMGGQVVKAGSWVLAAHVPDDNLWEQVKKGHKGAWSVGGSGRRSPMVEAVAKDAPMASPQPVHVHVNFGDGSITPVIHNHMPEHGEHTVNVHVPEQAAPVVHNHVEPAAAPEVHNHVNVEAPKPKSVRVETAEDGSKRYVPE